jgi:CO/xanthine dehydrogenase FAD-binding subunit
VDAAVDPEADIHASAEYRRRLARVLSQRALASAYAAATLPHTSPTQPGE